MEFLNYVDYVSAAIKKTDTAQIDKLIEIIHDAYIADRNIFIIGNGGSAANASHLAQDLSKGTLQNIAEQRRIKAISLTDNVAFISALGNDEGYDSIFVQQLITYARPNDLLIAISGSGNSPNILRAVEWANKSQITSIGITGFDGGELMKLVKHSVHVPLQDMCAVESAHSMIFHYLVITLKSLINL